MMGCIKSVFNKHNTETKEGAKLKLQKDCQKVTLLVTPSKS